MDENMKNEEYLEIKKGDLKKLILEKRKKQIDLPRLSSIGEIISGITLLVSVFTAEYDTIKIISPVLIKCLIFIIAIGLLIWGLYQIVGSLKNHFAAETLYKEIKALARENTFDIVLLKSNDEDGKYLVCRNSRWKGWLFANFPIKNPDLDVSQNIKNIAGNLNDLMKLDISDENIIYSGVENDRRCLEYSYGDNHFKIYRFRIYKATIKIPSEKQKPFQLNGQSYKWMTFDEMKKDKSFMKRNVHVYDHIVKYLQIN